MRSLSLLLCGLALAGCATSPPEPRSAKAEAHLNKLLAGKTAGKPVSCLPSYRSNDMVVIDNNTLAFRDGNRVYVNNLIGGCSNLGGHYALVTRSFGGGLCRGDIAQVADLSSGFTVGSCVMGDFVPYAKPHG